MNVSRKVLLACVAGIAGACAVLASADCLKNSTASCCSHAAGGPGAPVPCGASTCGDLIMTNPDIAWVDTGGDRKPSAWVMPPPSGTCTFQHRVCQNKNCVSYGVQTPSCEGSKFTTSQACP